MATQTFCAVFFLTRKGRERFNTFLRTQIMRLSSVSFLVIRVSRSQGISSSRVENNIQSRTKQLCGFRGSTTDPASAGFEARCVSRQVGPLSHSSPRPGNGQHAAATAQGTLIGGVTELSRRQRVNASTSRLAEEFASPARINTTPRSLLNRPTLRAALASQGAAYSLERTRTRIHVRAFCHRLV